MSCEGIIVGVGEMVSAVLSMSVSLLTWDNLG